MNRQVRVRTDLLNIIFQVLHHDIAICCQQSAILFSFFNVRVERAASHGGQSGLPVSAMFSIVGFEVESCLENSIASRRSLRKRAMIARCLGQPSFSARGPSQCRITNVGGLAQNFSGGLFSRRMGAPVSQEPVL